MSKLPAANPSPEAHTNDTLSQYIAFDDPKHHIRLYHGDRLETDLKLIRYEITTDLTATPSLDEIHRSLILRQLDA